MIYQQKLLKKKNKLIKIFKSNKLKKQSKNNIISLNNETINEILNYRGKSKFSIYSKILNIDIAYTYKNCSCKLLFL